jgi:hypothetical protein
VARYVVLVVSQDSNRHFVFPPWYFPNNSTATEIQFHTWSNTILVYGSEVSNMFLVKLLFLNVMPRCSCVSKLCLHVYCMHDYCWMCSCCRFGPAMPFYRTIRALFVNIFNVLGGVIWIWAHPPPPPPPIIDLPQPLCHRRCRNYHVRITLHFSLSGVEITRWW